MMTDIVERMKGASWPGMPAYGLMGLWRIMPHLAAVVSQPFRVVTVATLVFSTTLDTTVTGGVPRSTRHPTRGSGTCTPIPAMSTGPTTTREMVFRFVACGMINLFDYLIYLIINPANRLKGAHERQRITG